MCIIHAKSFWKWFLIPAIFIFIENFYHRFNKSKRLEYGSDVKIKTVKLLKSRVTHLVIKRPSNFRFKVGDYINIKVPAIAKHEWHPFYITSPPELSGTHSFLFNFNL
jgi:NADPH oxidase 5